MHPKTATEAQHAIANLEMRIINRESARKLAARRGQSEMVDVHTARIAEYRAEVARLRALIPALPE